MRFRFIFFLFLIAGAGVLAYLRFGQKGGMAAALPALAPMTFSEAVVTPTPMPFQELTIPYLRNRQYVSTLGARQRLSETGTYISYTTSYESDGLKINGLLTVPKGEKPENGWPAIVFVHGYIPPTLYE